MQTPLTALWHEGNISFTWHQVRIKSGSKLDYKKHKAQTPHTEEGSSLKCQLYGTSYLFVRIALPGRIDKNAQSMVYRFASGYSRILRARCLRMTAAHWRKRLVVMVTHVIPTGRAWRTITNRAHSSLMVGTEAARGGDASAAIWLVSPELPKRPSRRSRSSCPSCAANDSKRASSACVRA